MGRLARKVSDPSTPRDVREQAAERILKKLTKLAQRECSRKGLDPKHSWADEVASDALYQCFYHDKPGRRYNPQRGRFLAFAKTLIRNKITDRIRRARRWEQVAKKLAGKHTLAAPPGWYFQCPFSDEELAV